MTERSTPNLQLLDRAEREPDRLYLRYLPDGTPSSAVEISYGQLVEQARRIGAVLRERTEPGEPVLLLFAPGTGFVQALWGTLLAGRVIVPAYPPNLATLRRSLDRLRAIIEDVQAKTVLTSSLFAERGQALISTIPGLQDVELVAIDDLPPADVPLDPCSPDQLALIQYTSGSTSRPRGVAITHGQLDAQCRMLLDCFESDAPTRQIGWAPFYHDMGLIVGHFVQLYADAENTWMSPMHFLRQPTRWLRSMHHYRATTIVAPDFAFPLLARKCSPEVAAAFPLDALNTVVSSSEPVRMSSIQAFCDRFDVDPALFKPAFGLAENTLVATGGRPLTTLTVDARALSENQVRPVNDGQVLVSSGASLRGRCWIVDPDTRRRLPDAQVGEIWLDQPSKAQGYWKQPELTAERFQAVTDEGDGPFLRTGDLGFLHEGQLYVTGRLKDLIIAQGRNLYPNDIENVVETSHPAIRPGCSVAFGQPDAQGEGIVVVAELDSRDDPDLETIVLAIRRSVFEAIEVPVARVVLLRRGQLPKTSSGKVQRGRTAQQLERGELDVLLDQGELEEEGQFTGVLQELVARRIGIAADDVDSTLTLPELGIESVAYIGLQDELELRLGRSIKLDWLTRNLSIAQLARLIERSGREAHLVSMNSCSKGTPLFHIHGMLGMLHLADLADYLEPHRPCLGIEAPDLNSDWPFGSVEQMARAYNALLEDAYPEGPVILSGVSFGGVVAYEMAAQLRARGRDVPLVILFHSRSPMSQDASTRDLASEVPEFVIGTVRSTGRSLRREAAIIKQRLLRRRPPKRRKLPEGHQRMRESYIRYRAPTTDLRVLLFQGENAERHARRWKRLVGELLVVPGPGTHTRCLRPPHIQMVAPVVEDHIREALEAWEAQGARGPG